MSKMDKAALKAKIELEGGIAGALNYGIKASEIADPKLAELWAKALESNDDLFLATAEINQELKSETETPNDNWKLPDAPSIRERRPDLPGWVFETRLAGDGYVGYVTHRSGATISFVDDDLDQLMSQLYATAAYADGSPASPE